METICALKEVYKALYQYEKQFIDVYAITINEAMLLCCMKDGKAHTAGEICEYIGISLSRASKIITAMEQKSYIKRTIGKDDKRKMLFKLSESGKEKMTSMRQQQLETDTLCRSLQEFLKQV